jgi:hypothetical protein
VAAKTKLRRAASASAALPGAVPHAGLGTLQFGQTGLKRSYGYVYEELLPQLAGRKAINVYSEMSQNSDVIGAVLFAIDMFMRKVEWRVEPASQSGVDQKKAKFVASCKDDMDHTWPEFISEINTMLPFGWSWFEIVYKQRKNKAIDDFGTAQSQWDDGLIGWKRFMPASQESWWRWDFDPDTGATIGMWQRPAPDYSERYLPIGKSLHFRTTSRKDNPEGVSVLRNAYRSWYFLKRMEEIEAIGAERDLAGIPFATVPAEMMGENASADDINMVQSIVKMVQNVRRDQQEGIVWPQAFDASGHSLYDFKLLTTGGQRQFQTDPIISRYQTRIAMTVLADFLLLGTDSSGTGSYALATSKASMFQSALETWLNEIENVLNNRAIPLLFRQNGINSGPYPKFRHDIVQKPTLTDLATLISSMAGAGAQLFPDADLENHLREFAELPIRESNPANETTEDKIITQQLDTLLASSAAEQDMAQRTAQNATALGVVAAPEGAIVQRMDPVTLIPPAGGAPGAPAAGAAPTTPAKGSAQAVATNRAAKTVGMGGKQKGSAPGAPTKSTGPVKSGSTVPKNRRTTISTRAAQGAAPKSTGGLKTKSVAKNMLPMQDTAEARKRVKAQMSSDFPKWSMKWMDNAVWTGPVAMPADAFDTENENSWAASHEQPKVKSFKKKVKEGNLKPVVAVKIPGSNRLRIVDGHHHFLAYRQLGHPVLCYIAHVNANAGPWDSMHDYQRMSSDPDSSATQPVKKIRVTNPKPEPAAESMRRVLESGGSFKKTVKKYRLPARSLVVPSVGERLEKSMKLSQQEVSYRPAIDPERRCGTCSMFRISGDDEHGECTLVQGIIDPNDVCNRWTGLRRPRLAKSADIVVHTVTTPVKKCDHCQNPETKNWVRHSTGGIVARSCNKHVPQAKAELRWQANNQVSPVNPNPYEPFPRTISV